MAMFDLGSVLSHLFREAAQRAEGTVKGRNDANALEAKVASNPILAAAVAAGEQAAQSVILGEISKALPGVQPTIQGLSDLATGLISEGLASKGVDPVISEVVNTMIRSQLLGSANAQAPAQPPGIAEAPPSASPNGNPSLPDSLLPKR